MCLVSNITDVTIDIVSKNVIPNVCHWRMVAESKFDKKHLRTDNGSNVHPSHSPNREPSKSWVSVQIFLRWPHFRLYFSSWRDFGFELLKNIVKQGRLFKTKLKMTPPSRHSCSWCRPAPGWSKAGDGSKCTSAVRPETLDLENHRGENRFGDSRYTSLYCLYFIYNLYYFEVIKLFKIRKLWSHFMWYSLVWEKVIPIVTFLKLF